MDLQAFLSQLTEEGLRESSGTFTLDPARAREKLKQYQQPFPYAFVGSLMAAAHLSGAPAAAVQVKPAGLTLAWPSPELNKFQLQDIFSPLFVANSNPYLRELALGLNGALSMHPRRLDVFSGPWRQQIAPKEQTLTHSPTPGLRIELEYTLSQWPARKLLGRLPEIEFLKQRCQVSVPALQLNGQRLPIQGPKSQCLATAILQECPAFLRRALPPADFQFELRGPGPHGGIFALYKDEPGDFRLVVDGLSFPYPLSVPGARGFLVAPQLRRDLSAFALVENGPYYAISEIVDNAFRFLLQSLAESYDRIPPYKARELSSFLLHLAQTEASQNRHKEARQLYRKIIQCYLADTASYDWTFLRACYAAYLCDMTVLAPGDLRMGDEGGRFKEAVSFQLGLRLERQPDGCMMLENFYTADARRLRQEMYQLDRVILGSGHEITRQHET